MTIQELGSIGEFIAAIATVATLVYLAMQIRSNTRAVKASANFDAMHSWAMTCADIVKYPDDLIEAFMRFEKGGTALEDLPPEVRYRTAFHMRAIFQKLEGQYYLYKYGFLEEGVWTNRRDWARGYIDLAETKEWWANEKAEKIYSDEFAQAIEAGHAAPVFQSTRPS